MRAFDPRQRQLKQSKKRSIKMPIFVFVGFGILLVIGGILFFHKSPKPNSNTNTASVTHIANANNNLQHKPASNTLKIYTGQQFRDLYNNFRYPNTKLISDTTPITDNEQADIRIRQIAIQRGYQIRSAPVADTFQPVEQIFKLQQRAAGPWNELKLAAKKDGVILGLTAGYRSADEQKQIFLQRLNQIGITPVAVASGNYDTQISQVLRTTAIPGYSRHHTGYTIDIACVEEPITSFEYTNCFKWLKNNNYEHAKKTGWIPSYPENTSSQGPDPESWEYVWVGKDAVTE